ncbi:MAG: glycosyltransferase family 4 protein [Caldilineaceae bacterium]|nr:glycosyltransferase family 4 protein [Caldilineaceae bacterium]MBP8108405.1 glycosyltransferase family 4 protein [Caldilineaceae bacterium]MBP8124800.1 glycosyltransferase family 4 protein [Caldilineaceae bacterium]MBP9072468.1 glycosyltransferase family 4 protein [Caldilineaceae bacterium]
MSRPLLIGIDASRALRARRTGTERYSLEIIQHLLALPQAAQHTWRLYADSPPPPGLFPLRTPGAARDNVEIQVLAARRLWTHLALRRELVRHPPQVVFVPAHVLPWPTWGLPPSVVTIHDLGYRHFPESHGAFQRRYLAWGTRWSAGSARRVIAISQATAQDLARFDAIDPAKIRVIYEAAGPPQLSDRPKLVALAHLPAYGLFVSTIQPRKNVERLVRAFAFLVKTKTISWDLVLAGGKGWLSDQLYSLAGELGVADRVHFLGYVDDADLPGLYAHARLFCYPSLFEGFGLPVLEAQSYGVPVMTSNNSALPEVAGDAAILVDPMDIDAIADAMLRLSQDEDLRQRLIAAGYENVKRFSWDKAAKETLAVLEEAAREKQKAKLTP